MQVWILDIAMSGIDETLRATREWIEQEMKKPKPAKQVKKHTSSSEVMKQIDSAALL